MRAEYNMNKRFHRWWLDHIDMKYFDEEESEKVVENYITEQMVTDVEYDMEENDWFDNYVSEYSLVIFPNIPIVIEFFKKWNEEKAYLKVKPFIDSSLYNGHIEDVEITIPGKDDKTVILCAHLCHPGTYTTFSCGNPARDSNASDMDSPFIYSSKRDLNLR